MRTTGETMCETKVVVPDGMLKAALNRFRVVCGQQDPTFEDYWQLRMEDVLKAALSWLSENPIVPTEGLRHDLWLIANRQNGVDNECLYRLLAEFQRRMFRAPEPEVPEAIKDLLLTVESVQGGPAQTVESAVKEINARTLEAYRRGKGH